jgi:hypothetical protein
MYSNIPNQRIARSQKNKVWQKNCIDGYISLSNANQSERKRSIRRLYDYYNGVIHDEDYDYILRPYGKARKNFPSKLRNYPLIKPTIDLLLGEKAKRPFNYSVVAVNGDAVDRKEKAKHELISKTIHQGLANEMNEMGMETEQPSEPVPTSENLQALFERSYVDNFAVIGQKSLNYIMAQQDVHEKLQKAWFHFIVAGEAYTLRCVINNDVSYEILNPLDVDYDLDPDLDYVEDADWAIVTKYMGPSQIVKNFGRYLSKDQMEALYTDSSFDTNLLFFEDRREDIESRLIKVQHVYWQSLKRIGFLSYLDPNTMSEEMMEVEDGFVMPPELKEIGAKVEWEWHNEPWQAIRINEDFDVDVKPIEEFKSSIDNPSKIKLPINGRKYSDINTSNISLVMLGIPFQLNYNIYKYRLETSIARSKDIIAQLDINLIPKKWDMDKFMYFVEGTGIAWVDYDKEGVKLSPQHQTVMDLSVKTIQLYITLLEHIQMEWENVSGVNRQRRGEVGQYQGKAMGQQAIVQSSHTTEDLYRKFAGLEKRDLQTFIDLSKYAWMDGKKAANFLPDGAIEYFTIDPETWINTDLGIFVSDATKDVEKMNAAREMTQALAQNGVPFSTILETLEGENFVELKGKVKAAEASMQELQAAQSEAQQQAEQAAAEMEQQKHDDLMMSSEKERMLTASEGEKERMLKVRLKEMDMNMASNNVPLTDPREMSLKERAQSESERSNKSEEVIKSKAVDAKKASDKKSEK